MGEEGRGAAAAAARVPSGVPGLDAVLGGGFLRGGVYIVNGPPGAGKTTLGHQVCFAHIAGGGGGGADARRPARALYVTLLAEGHARMMLHLGGMRFFDAGAVADTLYYVSAFRALEEEGLGGLVGLMRREASRLSAGVVVLDGFAAAGLAARDDTDLKRFVHDLQAIAGATGCTVFLLASAGAGDERPTPEQTMVDGVVELVRLPRDPRTVRRLEVHKLRGSAFLEGRHSLEITAEGVVVHPRFEAVFRRPPEEDPGGGRIGTGVADLDAALRGGLPAATSTVVLGPSGAGKTTLGLHFLAAASAAEPALHFGFYETPPRLRAKARALGLGAGLDRAVEAGHAALLWQAPTEHTLDVLGHRLVGAVRRIGARRVVVDGLGGFAEGATDPERMQRFFAALANELRAAGATTLFTVEAPRLFGTEVDLPTTGISAVAENMLLLRLVELDGRLRRSLAVLKVRDSDFDPSLLGFSISDHGIALAPGAFSGAEGVTTGVAHRRRPAAEGGAGGGGGAPEGGGR